MGRNNYIWVTATVVLVVATLMPYADTLPHGKQEENYPRNSQTSNRYNEGKRDENNIMRQNRKLGRNRQDSQWQDETQDREYRRNDVTSGDRQLGNENLNDSQNQLNRQVNQIRNGRQQRYFSRDAVDQQNWDRQQAAQMGAGYINQPNPNFQNFSPQPVVNEQFMPNHLPYLYGQAPLPMQNPNSVMPQRYYYPERQHYYHPQAGWSRVGYNPQSPVYAIPQPQPEYQSIINPFEQSQRIVFDKKDGSNVQITHIPLPNSAGSKLIPLPLPESVTNVKYIQIDPQNIDDNEQKLISDIQILQEKLEEIKSEAETEVQDVESTTEIGSNQKIEIIRLDPQNLDENEQNLMSDISILKEKVEEIESEVEIEIKNQEQDETARQEIRQHLVPVQRIDEQVFRNRGDFEAFKPDTRNEQIRQKYRGIPQRFSRPINQELEKNRLQSSVRNFEVESGSERTQSNEHKSFQERRRLNLNNNDIVATVDNEREGSNRYVHRSQIDVNSENNRKMESTIKSESSDQVVSYDDEVQRERQIRQRQPDRQYIRRPNTKPDNEERILKQSRDLIETSQVEQTDENRINSQRVINERQTILKNPSDQENTLRDSVIGSKLNEQHFSKPNESEDETRTIDEKQMPKLDESKSNPESLTEQPKQRKQQILPESETSEYLPINDARYRGHPPGLQYNNLQISKTDQSKIKEIRQQKELVSQVSDVNAQHNNDRRRPGQSLPLQRAEESPILEIPANKQSEQDTSTSEERIQVNKESIAEETQITVSDVVKTGNSESISKASKKRRFEQNSIDNITDQNSRDKEFYEMPAKEQMTQNNQELDKASDNSAPREQQTEAKPNSQGTESYAGEPLPKYIPGSETHENDEQNINDVNKSSDVSEYNLSDGSQALHTSEVSNYENKDNHNDESLSVAILEADSQKRLKTIKNNLDDTVKQNQQENERKYADDNEELELKEHKNVSKIKITTIDSVSETNDTELKVINNENSSTGDGLSDYDDSEESALIYVEGYTPYDDESVSVTPTYDSKTSTGGVWYSILSYFGGDDSKSDDKITNKVSQNADRSVDNGKLEVARKILLATDLAKNVIPQEYTNPINAVKLFATNAVTGKESVKDLLQEPIIKGYIDQITDKILPIVLEMRSYLNKDKIQKAICKDKETKQEETSVQVESNVQT